MEMKIKTWIIDKAQAEAKRYNTWFDYSRRTEDISTTPLVEDGCYFVKIDEILQESEKAIQVKISTGAIDGSYKGWKLWVPKSQIMNI